LEFISPIELDEDDTSRLLHIAKEANYRGPMVLVNGGPGDNDWAALEIQREAIRNA